MRTTQALTVTLPADMAELVKAKVRSGAYASESDVIIESLQGLAEQDAAIEKWVTEEVMSTVEALAADPSRSLPAEETRKRLHAHIDRLVSGA